MGLHKRNKKWTKLKQEIAIDCKTQLAKDIAKYACKLSSMHETLS